MVLHHVAQCPDLLEERAATLHAEGLRHGYFDTGDVVSVVMSILFRRGHDRFVGGDGARIAERWTVAEDGLTMDRTMTVHDDYFAEPLVRTRSSQRGNARELLESPPRDATPFYHELLERGELAELLRSK